MAYSPGEFAELFGKSQTWGYRQIYAGKVIAITQHGRILIPAKEVERILEGAGIYNGKENPKQAKTRVESLSPAQKSVWQRFVESRRDGPASQALEANEETTQGKNARRSVLERVSGSWKAKPRKV